MVFSIIADLQARRPNKVCTVRARCNAKLTVECVALADLTCNLSAIPEMDQSGCVPNRPNKREMAGQDGRIQKNMPRNLQTRFIDPSPTMKSYVSMEGTYRCVSHSEFDGHILFRRHRVLGANGSRCFSSSWDAAPKSQIIPMAQVTLMNILQ